MAKNVQHVTQKEVGSALNNCLLLARDTQYFQELAKNDVKDTARRRRLYAYTEAHVSFIKDHVASAKLHPDEAILVLIGEAILIAGLFYKSVKLPMFGDVAKSILEDDGREINGFIDECLAEEEKQGE